MNRRIRNSVTLKLLSMGILMLLLLIPASMIQSLIHERGYTRQVVISEVNDKWGHAQTLAGPVLIVPYMPFSSLPSRYGFVILQLQDHALLVGSAGLFVALTM